MHIWWDIYFQAKGSDFKAGLKMGTGLAEGWITTTDTSQDSNKSVPTEAVYESHPLFYYVMKPLGHISQCKTQCKTIGTIPVVLTQKFQPSENKCRN